MTPDKTWREHVAKAEAHKALGTAEIYLGGNAIDDKPWHLATSCEPRGSHRPDISTTVWFSGIHQESGLSFHWIFDVEPHSAKGEGHYEYELDTASCRKVLGLLPPTAKASFRNYLADAAVKVEASAHEYHDLARREYGTAQVLRSLAKETETQ